MKLNSFAVVNLYASLQLIYAGWIPESDNLIFEGIVHGHIMNRIKIKK